MTARRPGRPRLDRPIEPKIPKKRGRPKGSFNKTSKKRITHEIGPWAWDAENLMSKILRAEDHACWTWQGSMGPQGPLFGAFKRHDGRLRTQMTQACRLLWQQTREEDVTDFQVKHHCGNRHCVNPDHLYLLADCRDRSRFGRPKQQ